jgi:hypothetical protein
MNFNRKITRALAPTLMVAAASITAIAAPGCDDNPLDALCCEEGDFQVGGTISADAEYSAEVKVAIQAVADIAGIASASIDDLTTACRAMAEELDAPEADRKAAAATEDKTERMTATCNLAVSAIGTFKAKAGGSLTVDIQPPQCSANVSAKASCQGGCSGSAECDIKANPPTCEGGSLEVACKGECTAKAGASLKCTGECTGSCEGKCTADAGGVECAGKCEGTCTAGGSAGGSGIQADGTCEGMCEGTCEVTAPSASCSGTCEGTCSASCQGSAEASVTCDGECNADFEPLKCEGGELKGGCQVEAKCEANCDASVKAKAECTPPSVNVSFSGAADVQAAGKLKAVLEANLGLVATLQARFEGLADAVVVVGGNVNADFLADIKVACIPVIVAALEGAVVDVTATVDASASILGSVG